MTTTFSRLANFREKKNNMHEESGPSDAGLKLTLPETEEKGYEPTTTFNNTRTSLRLLKGRIEKKNKQPSVEPKLSESNDAPQLTLQDKNDDFKLVLNDSPKLQQKKISTQENVPLKPTQKRILIAKQTPKQEQPKKVEVKQEYNSPPKQEKAKQDSYFNPHDEKPIIKQEEVQESKDQPENENDLIICPEGCGRKFNRRALQKHVKACKLVFMSKRKQFNSEAKRITSKEQASLIRQNKIKQKSQLGKTKSKGFDKTSDNWKAASEDFRSAIKAVKKDQGEEEEATEDAALVTVPCQYCDKKFASLLIEKHVENCAKKKEKEEKEKKKFGKKK